MNCQFGNYLNAASVRIIFWHTDNALTASVRAWFIVTTRALWMLSSIKK